MTTKGRLIPASQHKAAGLYLKCLTQTPHSRCAVSALRIQFFELSRVGRAFAYGDSIEAAALGRGGSAGRRRGGVIGSRRGMTPARTGSAERASPARVPSSFFDWTDGESTVTSSKVISTRVINRLVSLESRGDQDVSNPVCVRVGDKTTTLGWVDGSKASTISHRIAIRRSWSSSHRWLTE